MAGGVATASARQRAATKGRALLSARAVERLCWLALAALIALHVVAYSSKTIAAYATGQTLFDLATFEQGFWNATGGTLFFYSLEGELSRFGRHFSPIFFLLLPLYALHRDPSTLLVLQSLALGLAAVPLYLVARGRLGPLAALPVAALYLANPAVHDVNTVNEFHEIAFATPLLFLAFYAVERRRPWLYAAAVVGALLVKEDVALVTAALGLYVFLVARWRRAGLATVAGSVVWFLVVVEVVMPALRGRYGPVPFPGYEYLGAGPFGIARGMLADPGALWGVLTAEPKRRYLFWMLAPVAGLPLLAPEVLLIAAPGLLLILASTYPPTFAIFERYAAPIVPFVFLAAVVGIDRVRRRAGGAGPARGRRGADNGAIVTAVLILVLGGTTLLAQDALGKYPARLLTPATPDPHAATAIAFARAIPERASVVIEDHRWLAHAAHRRGLYFLSGDSPAADYLLLDRKVAPVTNVRAGARERAIRHLLIDQAYVHLRCEDGVSLYARPDAHRRDGPLFAPYARARDRDDRFGDRLRLRGYTAAADGRALAVTLYWAALRPADGAGNPVALRLLHPLGRPLAERRARPQDGACGTAHWQTGQVVRDPHHLPLDTPPVPGDHTLRLEVLRQDGGAL